MSMEQAILELVAAFRENTAALEESTAASKEATKSYVDAMGSYDSAVQVALVSPEAELEEAVGKVEKAAAKKNAQAEPSPAEPAAQTKSEPVALSDELAAPLDYRADVKPTLLKVHQDPRHGADALKALLKKYNAPNGDKLKPEDLPGILADAQALLAG